jgi:hypothetical protein
VPGGGGGKGKGKGEAINADEWRVRRRESVARAQTARARERERAHSRVPALTRARARASLALGPALPASQEFDRGTVTFELGANQVIKGWERGVTGMRIGGRRTLIVPPHLGYGSRGAPPKPGSAGAGIPPDAMLVFRLELINAQ